MTHAELDRLRFHWFGLAAWLGLAGLGLVSGYVEMLLQLSSAQWHSFALCLAGASSLCAAPFHVACRRALAPVRDALLVAPSARADEAGFHAALAAPLVASRSGLVWWSLGGVLVSIGMWIRHPELRGYPATTMSLAIVVSACLSVTVYYFLAKRLLAQATRALAARVPSPERRAALAPFFSTSRKLRVAVLCVVITPIVLSALLAQRRGNDPLEAAEARHQALFLESALASAPSDPHAAAEALTASARALGVASAVVAVDPASGRAFAGDAVSLDASELDRIRESSGASGDGVGLLTPHLFAWRRAAPEGPIFVALLSRSEVAASARGLALTFGSLALAFGGVALLLVELLARDLREAVEGLRTRAMTIASGDLREGVAWEAEDEFGVLGREMDRMSAHLRELLRAVRDAAGRVERTATDVASVSARVNEASREQSREIRDARRSVDSVSARVAAITSTADQVLDSAEQTSVSTRELMAAGGELREAAGHLTSSVDAMVASVQQATDGIGQIDDRSAQLARVADETTTWLQETSRAMHSVEQHADETATLSAQAASAAERGRERVAETAVGIEEIRGAAQAASGVAESLDRRAAEISEILDLIDGVADETNLLALNAAIISAQAGDAGRSFAVVADEIKGLAENVRQNAKEIGATVSSLQAESGNALAAIQSGATSAAAGSGLARSAGDALDEITQVAQETGRRNQEILGAVRDQTRVVARIAAQMDRVRAEVEQIRQAGGAQRSGHEQLVATGGRLREIARRVRATCEESAAGNAQIARAAEGVKEAVAGIHRALREQSEATQVASSHLAAIDGRTRVHGEAAESLDRATEDLHARADVLLASVARFQA